MVILGVIFIVTPTLGWAWPALIPVLSVTAGALGYKMITDAHECSRIRSELSKKMSSLRKISISLEEELRSEIEGELGRDQELTFRKDDIILTFRKDVRGKFFIDVMGPKTMSRMELRHHGKDFTYELVQKFAYNRTIQEFDRRGVRVVAEEVNENGDITLRVRRWQ